MKNIYGTYFSEYEITKEEWDCVSYWAKKHGYYDISCGSGKGSCPVGNITWYDSVKFCNALSEFIGIEPVYYDNNGNIYRNGIIEFENISMCTTSDGYRLPTSEEWHNACASNKDAYLFGDKRLNDGKNDYAWLYGESMLPKEVGLKLPNEYGLYDMVGNVCEWCFDKKDIFVALCGGSVALDSIVESGYTMYVQPYYKCFETGVRVCSSNKDIPNYAEKLKKSEYFGIYKSQELVYENMNEEETAKFLCENLDNSEMSLTVKNYVKKREFNRALDYYRDMKLKEFSRLKYDKIYERVFGDLKTLSEKDENEIKWFSDCNDADCSPMLEQLGRFLDKYSDSGNKKYLNAYFIYLSSYITRHKAEFDAMSDEMLLSKSNVPNLWAWGQGFDSGKRSYYIVTLLKQVAHLISENTDLFPSLLFAETALSLMTYGMAPMMKDGRLRIPNQVIHVAAWVLETSECFSEFLSSPVYSKIAVSRWKEGISKSLHPDGTATEQSIWYNKAFVEEYYFMSEKLNDKSVLDEIREEISNMNKMLCVIKTPYGMYPNSSVTIFKKAPYDINDCVFQKTLSEELNAQWHLDCDVKNRMNNAMLGKSAEEPKFTSVFFPYGGVSVIREGWNIDSRYMYFFAPRKGSGHTAEAVNDIQLCGYGRDFLISGGMNTYGFSQTLPEEQREYAKEFDTYSYSSLSKNTVLVDGKGQARNRHTEQHCFEAYPDVIGYKWLDSENFVYTEGIYKDGYYGAENIVHHREIIFDKRGKLFFVIDTVSSDISHIYTLNWSIMPNGISAYDSHVSSNKKELWKCSGFKPENIIADDEKNIIYTNEKGKPNIFIRSFSEHDLSYKTYIGETDSLRGWYVDYNKKGICAYQKKDICVNTPKVENAIVVSVIELSPDENSEIINVASTKSTFEFKLKNYKYKVSTGKQFRVDLNGDGILLDYEKNEYYEYGYDGKKAIPIPETFKWKDGKPNYKGD